MAIFFSDGLSGTWFAGTRQGPYRLNTGRFLLGSQRSSLERSYPPGPCLKNKPQLGLRGKPSIATTCGEQIPCTELYAPASALGQLGALFCPELSTILDALNVALKRAPRLAGNQFLDARADAAAAFWTRHDKVFGAPIYGDSCKSAVDEGKRLLAGVNAYLVELGAKGPGGTVDIPQISVTPSEGPAEQLTKVKTIAIAVAVVAGAVVVAPVVWRLAASKLLKAKAG